MHPYHGQRSPEDRKAVHLKFVQDRVTVVVATLAFGMGIDKPDVRLVVHWGPPKTVEAYYQQAGRAGRDGEPAQCTLFVKPGDWVALERLLTHGVSSDTAARALSGLGAMRAFCESRVCRRVGLAVHFGETAPLPLDCGVCDTCIAPSIPHGDVAAIARPLLGAVRDLEGRYGAGTVMAVVRGVPPAKHASALGGLMCLGGAKFATEVDMKRTLQACRDSGLVQDETRTSASFTYAAPVITAAGVAWMADASSALSAPIASTTSRGSSKRPFTSTGGSAGAGAGNELFERLRGARASIARDSGIAAYMVCSDATLREMAQRRPDSSAALLKVHGMGTVKVKRYGDRFLRVVQG